MKTIKNFFVLSALFVLTIVLFNVYGCNENSPDTSFQSEDEYIKNTALNSAFSTNADDDDNLFSNEVMDFDSEGPVKDGEGGFDTPIDSLLKWGRRVTGTNVNVNITSSGDTLKFAEVTRVIIGNFIVLGYINGQLDSAVKPYRQEQRRTVTFKRVDRRPNPRFNWRLYQYSAVDGETKTPQTGKDNIIMNKIEIFVNNNLIQTLKGPDFTINIFTSKYFGGGGLFTADRNDQIKVKVFLTSNQTDTDIVAFHWARNAFGFHREPFVMTSQTPNGNNFDRIYEKTFSIFPQHNQGIHNSFISSNTRSSLYDNSTNLFSSTYMGIPYRIRQ